MIVRDRKGSIRAIIPASVIAQVSRDAEREGRALTRDDLRALAAEWMHEASWLDGFGFPDAAHEPNRGHRVDPHMTDEVKRGWNG